MSSEHNFKMWTPRTLVILVLMIIGIWFMLMRMTKGLGAVTDLNHEYPWGFWLGFDVLGGVAMAAGGFIIACAIYIFNWKKYKPIGRPAILTAFLGYMMAVIAIFLDIGHPFRLPHPMIMWQVHSVMWVVAIHVILYTTTLAIESSPMLLERLKLVEAKNFVGKIMVPAVIFGVMLSTLHQASLGAVFLIAPSKMSPLWFTNFMPYMFLISAVAMGLCMVSTEAMLSEKAFNHKVDKEIYYGLARGTLITLCIYLVFKLIFLFKNAGLGLVLDGSVEGNMYILEMVIGVIIPIILLANKSVRTNVKMIAAVNWIVIIGVLLNRMNVGVFSMNKYAVSKGGSYFPTLPELLITVGIVCIGIFLFKMAAVHLPLFEHSEEH